MTDLPRLYGELMIYYQSHNQKKVDETAKKITLALKTEYSEDAQEFGFQLLRNLGLKLR